MLRRDLKINPFCRTYVEARAAFREAATGVGSALHDYHVRVPNYQGALTIDVACFGHPQPKWSLVISSGLHGVEGFFGSAVQLSYLRAARDGIGNALRGRYVFIHALNPFGFATLRRVNEDNVDLNRNFLLPGEPYSGASKSYARLNAFLNPACPAGPGNFYTMKALWNIFRMGYGSLKQAVAEGQFEFPHGIFFGGRHPAQSTTIFKDNIKTWTQGLPVVHLDMHTGLGEHAKYKLLVPKQRTQFLDRYSAIFGGDKVEVIGGERGVAYDVRGDLGRWVTTAAGRGDYHFLFAEFGTYSGVRVLGALRKENQAYFYPSKSSSVQQRAKAELLECFCPASSAWRRSVVARGLELIRSAERLAVSLEPAA
jgi:Protein of unknown function (DUF2817)